jgi:hypothetical protein
LSSIRGYKDSSKKNSERSENIMKRTEEIEAKQAEQAQLEEKIME